MSETYEIVKCEQSWHTYVMEVLMIKVPAVNTAGMLTAKERCEAFAAVYGWEYLESLKNDGHPIAVRNECRRQAGGKNCSEATIKAALKNMLTWDGVPSTTATTASVHAQNAQLKGELAQSKMNMLKAAREQAKMMLDGGMKREAVKAVIAANPELDAEAVVSAAEQRDE